MVLNAAVQVLREADDLKQKILKFNSGTSMLQDKTLWTTQQQLQKVYQKVLMLDLDYALEKKVEQDLWNIGFKQQIEALQAISKDRKNPLRSEAQPMLSWVLQAAAGFYLCLLHQICSTFKLDLPFRRRASLLGAVEGWEACPVGGNGATGVVAARYACQHCLVHLGDLARYRQQLRVAYTFYRHALAVSVHSGQPYNQLALVAWRRGRRLAAVYWHVRSLLVRAPFPPAPANLARTLAAAASRDVKEAPAMPVLPGLSPKSPAAHAAQERLDAHTYGNELVRVLHYLHTAEQLETTAELVNTLNTALSPLIATDSFDAMTLIKMACVIIWVVQSSREDFSVELSALSEAEAAAAALATELAAGALLALLLPAYTAPRPPPKAMPALKVWLSWLTAGNGAQAARALAAPRPQLWPALAHVLNALAAHAHELTQADYDVVPLPEDEELHGFVPLQDSFKGLKFTNQSGFDGTTLPEFEPSDTDDSSGISELSLVGEPELEAKVRARRIVRLGQRLAEQHPEHITFVTKEDGLVEWTASTLGGEQLNRALEPLRLVAADSAPDAPGSAPDSSDTSVDSARELRTPPPPLIISEADFREKVREKRVGILKPQGSLERAREERALANTQDDPEVEGDDGNKSEEKKEVRKARVNIAMAAIMRKQEETNKQVKFVTPPPTPDLAAGSADPASKDEKPKVIQPKAIKSLANLPVGRKTGGILSLKDKSAGYPHLVNADPEPKKPEKEEKKEKSSQGNSQNSQNYQQKRQEQIPTWPNVPMPAFNEEPRMNFQKNYGIQSAGISYNPNYQPPTNNQGIRLPVVNPKEIDVRTAALQKQSARQDMFPDGKFGNHYQMSGDKKNFLNDLPPRFANQYRYWQTAQENQFNDNKFRDDNMKPSVNFSVPPPTQNWAPPQGDNFQQAPPWWKLDSNFAAANYQAPMNLPNYYQPIPNIANPYQNVAFNQMQNQNMGQNKPENLGASYLQQSIGQSQLQTLQNLVTSPNFNSNLTNYGPYAAPVSYDSSMYPQFNKLSYPPAVSTDKPGQAAKELDALSYGANILGMQQRNVSFNEYKDGVRKPDEAEKQSGGDGGGAEGMGGAGLGGGANMRGGGANAEYSLFSAAPAAAWPRPLLHQSLWSGPGPSPLERLLEQQKQMKQPPPPQ